MFFSKTAVMDAMALLENGEKITENHLVTLKYNWSLMGEIP